MGDFIQDLLSKFIADAAGAGLIKSGTDILEEFAFSGDVGITGISDVVLPIASVLVCIYFMIVLMDKIATDNFSTDQFISLLIKLVFAILITQNAEEITSKIMSFGGEFLKLMNTGSVNSINVDVGELGFFEALFAFVLMLIPWVLAQLAKLVMYFFTFGYSIELAVRVSLAPIGFADLISGGANSNGYRYLKKLIAMAMQGGIMILIMAGGAKVQNTVIDNFHLFNVDSIMGILTTVLIPVGSAAGSLLQIIGIQFATVGLLGSAKTIANDLVG